jgi:hypothetical protein
MVNILIQLFLMQPFVAGATKGCIAGEGVSATGNR